MARTGIRATADIFRRTPMHPQWLLGPRRAPGLKKSFRGRILDIGSGGRWMEKELPGDARHVPLDYPATGVDLCGGWDCYLRHAGLEPVRKEQSGHALRSAGLRATIAIGSALIGGWLDWQAMVMGYLVEVRKA